MGKLGGVDLLETDEEIMKKKVNHLDNVSGVTRKSIKVSRGFKLSLSLSQSI